METLCCQGHRLPGWRVKRHRVLSPYWVPVLAEERRTEQRLSGHRQEEPVWPGLRPLCSMLGYWPGKRIEARWAP